MNAEKKIANKFAKHDNLVLEYWKIKKELKNMHPMDSMYWDKELRLIELKKILNY